MTTVVSFSHLPKVPKIEYPAEYEPVSSEALIEIVVKLSTVFAFLASKGMTFLKQEVPLSYQEWRTLFDHAFEVWNALSGRFTRELFEVVIQRGIVDITQLLPSADDDLEGFVKEYREGRSPFAQWAVNCLSYNLCKERIQTPERLRRATERFLETVAIPLIRVTGGKCGHDLIESCAIHSYPGDSDGQEMFKKKWVGKVTN